MVITASRNHKWLCKDDIRSIRPGTAASGEVAGRKKGLEPGPGPGPETDVPQFHPKPFFHRSD